MTKPKKSKIESELEALDNPTASPPPPPPAPATRHETVSKSEAVRRAVAAGHDKPLDGCRWIKEQYGLMVTPSMFSTVKLGLKKQTVTKVGTGNLHRPRLPGLPVANGTVSVELLKSVKQLISQYGADAVRQMTDVLAD